MLCHVMLSYAMLINFYAGLLLQPVMAGFPGGPQTKRKNKKKNSTNKHKILQKNNDTIPNN